MAADFRCRGGMASLSVRMQCGPWTTNDFFRRVETGCWPRIEDGIMRLSAAQLAGLIEGLDIASVITGPWYLPSPKHAV
jgi:hypothetical protein